jgi:hypothetical protein
MKQLAISLTAATATNPIAEHAARPLGRMIGSTVHYAGLVALLAGLGMGLAALTWGVTRFHNSHDLAQGLTYFQSNAMLFSGAVILSGGAMTGLLAAAHSLQTRKIAKVPDSESELAKRQYFSRVLWALAALAIACGSTSLILHSATVRRAYNFVELKDAPVNALGGLSIPIFGAGAVAAIGGQGVYYFLRRKLTGAQINHG